MRQIKAFRDADDATIPIGSPSLIEPLGSTPKMKCDHCARMVPMDGELRLGEICGTCNVGAFRLLKPEPIGSTPALSGTMECPVCGSAEPHHHSDEEIQNWPCRCGHPRASHGMLTAATRIGEAPWPGCVHLACVGQCSAYQPGFHRPNYKPIGSTPTTEPTLDELADSVDAVNASLRSILEKIRSVKIPKIAGGGAGGEPSTDTETTIRCAAQNLNALIVQYRISQRDGRPVEDSLKALAQALESVISRNAQYREELDRLKEHNAAADEYFFGIAEILGTDTDDHTPASHVREVVRNLREKCTRLDAEKQALDEGHVWRYSRSPSYAWFYSISDYEVSDPFPDLQSALNAYLGEKPNDGS